ncbi:MAG TPA: BTAD domain-containing putative transcriptional regulator [Anaerolineae bacterium]|nr:BTAD domain-containing putative transcriptional regulator [Anaerolineae bacterium]
MHRALFLFGPPRIERDGAQVPIGRRKALALVAYLAAHDSEPFSRDTLAALLWPESDQARARAALRRTLVTLNAAGMGDALAIQRDTIGLHPDTGLWVDVKHFRRLLASAHRQATVSHTALTEAVALYRDDFLAGFTLRDSPAFDEWQFFQAEGLRRDLASALERLVRYYADGSELETAIGYARRWLALDPLHEPPQRWLMQLYAQAGEPAAAVRQYQELARRLENTLGLSPQPETIQLYEVIKESRFPLPLSGLNETATDRLSQLPVPATPFVGRAEELAEIVRCLADPNCRLLTLIGHGGVGKTRLALEATTRQRAVFADGVCFISLAGVQARDVLIERIANALELAAVEHADLLAQIFNLLRRQTRLLIFDSFEQLFPEANLLAELLACAPQVKVLVTSRERLKLQAEWSLELQGLPFPLETDCEDLEAYDAVRLFVQSAQRTRPYVTLTPVDQIQVAHICRLLAGLPLGIELAATWTRVLACAEIAEEITRSLDFLNMAWQDVPERHRSLRAVFEESWRLLSEAEQRALRQLSIFRGGFTSAAAQYVAGAQLPRLAALMDKSLLGRNRSGRYDLHTLVWQFATEKLREAADEHEQVGDRHSRYYAALIEQGTERLRDPQLLEVLSEVSDEMENVQASWRWAIEHRRATLIEQSCRGLYGFYQRRGWFQEGAEAFEQAVMCLGDVDAPPTEEHAVLRSKLLARLGVLYTGLGLYEKARAALQPSIALLREAGQQVELASALLHSGMLELQAGEYMLVKQLLEESLSIYRSLDDPSGAAQALNILGYLAGEMGNYAEAEHRLEESLWLSRSVHKPWQVANTLNSLGYVIHRLGDQARAQQTLEESLALSQALNHPLRTATLANLGLVALAREDYAAAKAHFCKTLQVALDLHLISMMLAAFGGLATLLAQAGQAEQALELLAFVRHHPASPQEARDRVAPLWAELAATLPATVVATAEGRGKTQIVEQFAAALLNDHAVTAAHH